MRSKIVNASEIYTSRFAVFAFDWMNDLRDATSVPMRMSKTRSASCASSTVTCLRTRFCGCHILVPLQNIASLHCSSRCDTPQNDDWPPRGLLDDGPDDGADRPE